MVRRALAMAAGEQYFRLAISFALIASVSRLLTPAEIGISVIGTGVMTIALGLREFATSDFLIQRERVALDDLRASFTVLILLTAVITAGAFAVAPWLGTFYSEERLADFLRVAAVAGLVQTPSLPIMGLLRREMAFGTVAIINIASTITSAGVTIVLAVAGLSYMSFAWAALAGAAVTTFISFYYRPDLSVLRPTLKAWRIVLSFGGYNGVSFMINRIYETLPQLVLGRILPHSAVGLYNRATVVSDIPDKIILTSVFSVAFPALAAEIRQGTSLNKRYLRALCLITVFYWPGQVLLMLLAHPVVSLLLGHQWLGMVPLVQVMAIAGLAWFPVVLTSPVLLAVGANRDRVTTDLIGRFVSATILCSAAWFGVMAMAASKLITLPFQMVLSFYFVRRHIPFQWRELRAELWRSGVAAASSAVGPILVVALSDAGFDLSLTATVVALLLAGSGWLIAVSITRHPVLHELKNLADKIVAATFMRCRVRDGKIGQRSGVRAAR